MLDVATADAAAQTSVVAVRTRRDIVDVVGADAASYLQGQLSQDVEGLAVGSSAVSLLLQPQGKVDAWLRITRVGSDHYRLDVDAGYGEAMLARLRRFLLRVDATLTLAGDVAVVALRGPATPDAASLTVGDDVTVVPALDALTLGGLKGLDLLGADEIPPGFDEGPSDALDAVRIRAGVPAMGRELDEDTIPAAAGVVEPSVDFTKGCYVGQELVARIDSRGSNTPTRLHRLRPAVPLDLATPADLVADGVAVGRLTSYAVGADGPVGLGYLKRSVTIDDAVSVVDGDGSVVAVEVIAPVGA